MAKFRGNHLLIGTLGALMLYWSSAAILPGTYMSAVGSLVLLVFGGLSFFLYMRTALQVVVFGYRSEQDDGSHLAVYGTWLLGAGAVWSGLFGFFWIMSGQPPSWTGTAVSSFSRYLIASGFLLVFFAPQTTREGLGVRNSAWVLIAIAVSLCAGVIIGLQLKVSDPLDQWRILNRGSAFGHSTSAVTRG